jgi:hypothetical protein
MNALNLQKATYSDLNFWKDWKEKEFKKIVWKYKKKITQKWKSKTSQTEKCNVTSFLE